MCPHRSKVQGKVFILWYTTGYRRSGAQGKIQGYKGKCVPRVEGIQGTQGGQMRKNPTNCWSPLDTGAQVLSADSLIRCGFVFIVFYFLLKYTFEV